MKLVLLKKILYVFSKVQVRAMVVSYLIIKVTTVM